MSEPDKNLSDQVAEMTASVQSLTDHVSLADDVVQRQRFVTRLWKAAIVLVAVLAAVGFVSLHSTATSNHDSVCRLIDKHDLLVDKVEEAVRLVNAPTPGRSENTQAALDKFVLQYTATVEAARVPHC